MNLVQNDDFNEYIETYKKLPLKEKKQQLKEQVEELVAALYALNERYGKEPKILYNREIIDLKNEEISEEDFVEALFVYSYTTQELLASLIESIEK